MQRKQKIIEVEGISVGFGEKLVLNQLSMDVYQSEIMGIIGASGCGKSVLLRTIVGLVEKRAGIVRVFSQRQGLGDQRKPCPIWSVLFQDGALFSSLTVRENIQVPMKEYFDLPQQVMDELAALKIKLVGLPLEAGEKFPFELSGGMRKRAGLARALALDPEIMFLDEPTAGLDPIGAADFDMLIARMSRSIGISVFMVTHDLDSLYTICDRIAVIGDGKILATGTLEEVREFKHPWVHAYFHGARGCRGVHVS